MRNNNNFLDYKKKVNRTYKRYNKHSIKRYIMKQDTKDKTHYIADEGKVFKRIIDEWIAGPEIYLGYCYYLNDEPLDEPYLEKIEDYVEVEDIYNKED